VLGLDPETRKLVRRGCSLTGFHIAGVLVEKNPQVSVPVVQSILLTGPLSSLQKNGNRSPIQYLSLTLLLGWCLRFEGKSPSVAPGLHVHTRGHFGHQVLHQYPAKENAADQMLQAVSLYLEKGGIIHS